ncbi:hypothetical protein FVER53590_29017 [Fusarium verticillioides]|nr:hypothetical protein FVER53590_29017 [Fusarium verticillioides]
MLTASSLYLKSFVHPALFLFEEQLAGCMITRRHNLTDKSKPLLSRMEDVGTGRAYEKPDFITQLCFNPALNNIPILQDDVFAFTARDGLI